MMEILQMEMAAKDDAAIVMKLIDEFIDTVKYFENSTLNLLKCKKIHKKVKILCSE